MVRLLLVHWKPEEAASGVALLRRAGHTVAVYSKRGGVGLREQRAAPPDILLVDCSRLPSHGREVADFFRHTKATRHLPLVFLDGEEEKLTRTRQLFPDAVFAPWRRVRGAVREAKQAAKQRSRAGRTHPGSPNSISSPAATIPGYSGTPLPRKLGLKPHRPAILVNAPPGVEQSLAPLPEGAVLRRGARGRAPLVLLFAPNRGRLAARFDVALRAVEEGGRLWLAWPKKTGALASDLGQAEVRRFGLERGLVDFKICAIDDDWSGLAFARRR